MRTGGLSAENITHAEMLRMRLISASQQVGVDPTRFFELLTSFLDGESWTELGIDFVGLVEQPPPVGMGLGREDFKKLLTLKHRYEKQDRAVREQVDAVRTKARDLLHPELADNGGDRKSEQYQFDNIKLKHGGGTSETYTLRRLKRDRSDLAQKVISGEMSANAAAIEAGFRDKTFTVSSNVDKAARTLRKHFDPDELCRALKGNPSCG
jgi:hypothetical protein